MSSSRGLGKAPAMGDGHQRESRGSRGVATRVGSRSAGGAAMVGRRARARGSSGDGEGARRTRSRAPWRERERKEGREPTVGAENSWAWETGDKAVAQWKNQGGEESAAIFFFNQEQCGGLISWTRGIFSHFFLFFFFNIYYLLSDAFLSQELFQV
jgi:hypothetical protein